MPLGYQHLLAKLYDNQRGTLGHGSDFEINRGVRQGDVLSPLLFNSGLELVMRRWKARLTQHGIKLDDGERLCCARFADDLIIYASSFAELVDMLDILVEELRAVGLELNAKKSKIFTTDRATVESAHPILVDCADAFIEVMRAMDTHKYLGCCYPGDLLKREPTILEARLRCAWSKFSLFRHSLVNRHVDIKLRLRLFESVVTPVALYALTTAPLSAKSLERLAVCRNKL